MSAKNPNLSTAVLEALQTGTPRSAKDIAKELRQNPTLLEASRAAINSLLYGELSSLVEKGSDHRWSLIDSDNTSQSPSAPSDFRPDCIGTPANQRMSPLDRGSYLRTVERLRSGLPPAEHLEKLTVGDLGIIAAATAFLDRRVRKRWLLIAGNYGEGKSHALQLVRDMAIRRGMAHCVLSSDGYGSALNHPQRFLPLLLSTLEIPGHDFSCYQDLVVSVASDPKTAPLLRRIVFARLATGRSLDIQARWQADACERLSESNDVEPQELDLNAARLAYHLCGESIRHRGGTAGMREAAYALLGVAIDLLSTLGIPRLVMTIDEAESIFTKLPGVASRRGAYRVLSALCESPELASLAVVVAVTPDGLKTLKLLQREELIGIQCLGSERVRRWTRAVSHRDAPLVECVPLEERDRSDLLKRVRDLYESAYSISLADSQEAFWKAFATEAAKVSAPIRILVRMAVDLLDALRYGNGLELVVASDKGS